MSGISQELPNVINKRNIIPSPPPPFEVLKANFYHRLGYDCMAARGWEGEKLFTKETFTHWTCEQSMRRIKLQHEKEQE